MGLCNRDLWVGAWVSFFFKIFEGSLFILSRLLLSSRTALSFLGSVFIFLSWFLVSHCFSTSSTITAILLYSPCYHFSCSLYFMIFLQVLFFFFYSSQPNKSGLCVFILLLHHLLLFTQTYQRFDFGVWAFFPSSLHDFDFVPYFLGSYRRFVLTYHLFS